MKCVYVSAYADFLERKALAMEMVAEHFSSLDYTSSEIAERMQRVNMEWDEHWGMSEDIDGLPFCLAVTTGKTNATLS